MEIENGNSDRRTEWLVWKCVSDHFLTAGSVVLFLICETTRNAQKPNLYRQSFTTFRVKTKIKISKDDKTSATRGQMLKIRNLTLV